MQLYRHGMQGQGQTAWIVEERRNVFEKTGA